MSSEKEKELLNKINHEIELPESEMDTDSIRKMMDEYLDNQKISVNKREAKKMADKIIMNHSETKPTQSPNKHRSVLVPVIATLLFVSFLITAVAQKDAIMHGVILLGEKLNIITPSSTAPTETEQPNEKAVKALFASGKYYLPHDLLSNYFCKNYYENSRTSECKDICMEFVNSTSFVSIVISNYESAEAAGIVSPSANMQPETQLNVNGLDIYIFQINQAYTVYYSADNVAYQITTDMSYSDLCTMLNSVSK